MAGLIKIEEIRGKDTRELRLDLQELQKELFQIRFRGATEAVVTTARFKQIRKNVARILTVVGERERASETEKAPKTGKAKKGGDQ